MFNISISIIAISFDIDKNERCFISLSEDKYTPLTINLSKTHDSILDAAKDIFEQHIRLGFAWISPRIIDIIKDNDDNVHIIYCCTIPPGTNLVSAYNISSNISIINPLCRKALLYV